ncbi:UNKNOWN [Stylonychia lemnae]|uniref:Uncharacterized protein n=1 Tax=Stylonychia lemnae TaxID=5949 RepID=A0A078A7L7_STYLE|nr:UNKNOWN [Stylonychia lemnae]|eukprot:CDW77856.1 UNKNOWN [Stylonychia lemnae]
MDYSSLSSQITSSTSEQDDQASSINTFVPFQINYQTMEETEKKITEDKPVKYNRDNALNYLLIALLYEENRQFQQCIHIKMLYQEHRNSVIDFAGYTPKIQAFLRNFQLPRDYYNDIDKILVLVSILDALICSFQKNYINAGYSDQDFLIIDKFLVMMVKKTYIDQEMLGENTFDQEKVNQFRNLLNIIKESAAHLRVFDQKSYQDILSLNPDDTKQIACSKAATICLQIQNLIVTRILENRQTLKYILSKLSDNHFKIVYLQVFSGIVIQFNSETDRIQLKAYDTCNSQQFQGKSFQINCTPGYQQSNGDALNEHKMIISKIQEKICAMNNEVMLFRNYLFQ